MKKLFILFITLLVSLSSNAYTWNSLGADTANITRICFAVAMPYHALCSDGGFYLYNYGTNACGFVEAMPVAGVAYFNQDKVLVAQGMGTFSDGVYTYDIQTHQFEVMEWYVYPTFLNHHQPTQTYWMGNQWDGMMNSSDGVSWGNVPFFNAKPCLSFADYGQHMVVTAISGLSNIYWSPDSGTDWYHVEDFPGITDMSFAPDGMLYGVCPGTSATSGLYLSEDYGETWQLMFQNDNLSTVGVDAFGDIFVGWKDNGGLARYDPNAPPPGFTYFNSGLPNLNINRIQLNPTMSAAALFVSTEGGAWYSMDYMVGIEYPEQHKFEVSVFPNPADDKFHIRSEVEIHSILLVSFSGGMVFASDIYNTESDIDVSSLLPGVYIFNYIADNASGSKKVMIR